MPSPVMVITGATSGIGLAAARVLAAQHHIVIVGRSAAKAEAARQSILTAYPQAQLSVELADFADLGQVADLAGRLRAQFPRIDVLVNNAGLYVAEPLRSLDGFELTFAVNHLAPFLLTNLLLEPLRAARARIVNVSSAAHFAANPDLQRIADVGAFNGWRAYSDSKLCNILFSNELARRLAADGVTSNSLHPGMVATNFGKNADPLTRTFFSLARPLMISAERGAETIVHLAAAPEVAAVSGAYYDNRRAVTPSRSARDTALAAALWQRSSALVGDRLTTTA